MQNRLNLYDLTTGRPVTSGTAIIHCDAGAFQNNADAEGAVIIDVPEGATAFSYDVTATGYVPLVGVPITNADIAQPLPVGLTPSTTTPTGSSITVTVRDTNYSNVPNAPVAIIPANNSVANAVQHKVTDQYGQATFTDIAAGEYYIMTEQANGFVYGWYPTPNFMVPDVSSIELIINAVVVPNDTMRTITLHSSTGGTIAANPNGTVLQGTSVTFSATADATHTFDHFDINGVVITSNPYTMVVGMDVDATAYFKNQNGDIETSTTPWTLIVAAILAAAAAILAIFSFSRRRRKGA